MSKAWPPDLDIWIEQTIIRTLKENIEEIAGVTKEQADLAAREPFNYCF